ncbi:MAG: hypothetical protein ICV75_01955 [Nitrospiraceae bacterium]|nr:hypothetical protein [Nitrospiraceae bacterium]
MSFGMNWAAMRRSGVLIIFLLLCTSTSVIGQTANQFPGGLVERQGNLSRTKWSPSYIQSFIPPSRGAFTFPSPYNTRAIRITDASDCGGQDCVAWVSYSYWRNTNAHQNSNTMWIFVALMTSRGGAGPTLFQYDKTTDAISKVGPLFPTGSRFLSSSGEGWYFSGSMPNKLYMNDGTKMLRYDVVSRQFDTVFDIGTQYGSNRYLWQMHSSNDDRVHIASVRDGASDQVLGCVVFNESSRQMSYFPRTGTLDECNLDKSGRYVVLLDELNGNHIMDNVFIDLQSGARRTVYDAMGHLDMGYGYILGGDPFSSLPNAQMTRSFAPTFVTAGPAVFYNVNWNVSAAVHVSHTNARSGAPLNEQFACGSGADRTALQNEVTCFRLDTSYQQLVVAPIMTNLDAAGGCCAGDYGKMPKGNLDLTGRYFVWTTNLGGNRLDAFLVKVPSQALVAGGDTTPPSAPQNLRID